AQGSAKIPFHGDAGGPQKQVDGCELTGRYGVVRSLRIASCVVLTAMAMGWTEPAFSLDPRYPDWPCQQLKVPEISIANVWSGPAVEPADTAKPVDAKEAELVSRL